MGDKVQQMKLKMDSSNLDVKKNTKRMGSIKEIQLEMETVPKLARLVYS